jgi:hypothetical protein
MEYFALSPPLIRQRADTGIRKGSLVKGEWNYASDFTCN